MKVRSPQVRPQPQGRWRIRSLPLLGVVVSLTVLVLGAVSLLGGGPGTSDEPPVVSGPPVAVGAPRTTTPPASRAAVATAADAEGWGAPGPGSDEFTGSTLDDGRWETYDGDGNAGYGTRTPDAVRVHDGMLTITGDADATTGGVANRTVQRYGRWEARMRTSPLPGTTGRAYHPVLLLWPANGGGDSKPGGSGGELDFAEADTGTGVMNAFLHPSRGRDDQFQVSRQVDLAEWHTYAMEWTPTAITGWIDGQRFFTNTDRRMQPGGPMGPTIQLDAFTSGGLAPATMDVDWFHVFPPPGS